MVNSVWTTLNEISNFMGNSIHANGIANAIRNFIWYFPHRIDHGMCNTSIELWISCAVASVTGQLHMESIILGRSCTCHVQFGMGNSKWNCEFHVQFLQSQWNCRCNSKFHLELSTPHWPWYVQFCTELSISCAVPVVTGQLHMESIILGWNCTCHGQFGMDNSKRNFEFYFDVKPM